jgi:S1-C subfamily serine protease
MVPKQLSAAAALTVAGLVGGAAALAVGSVIWDGDTTTVVERADAAPTAVAAFADEPASSVGDIYRTAGPGVVQITSEVVAADPLFGESRGRSLGSGFVWDTEGHIVTNYHVVEGAERVFVNFTQDDRLEAAIVGTDPSTDLALLEIDVRSKRALSPIPLGDSRSVRVGDEVVAIGNPFGLDRTVTRGIVSAVQREIQSPNNFTIDEVIQTDAAINSGNSGGPLLNAEGRVIGVNTQIATAGSEGNVGIGFAVPVNTVKQVVAELLDSGRVDHAYLGITMADLNEEVARLFNLPAEGVLIASVRPGSPAERAGLRGGDTNVVVDGTSYVLGGDVVLEVDGQAVERADELRSAVAEKEPGDELRLRILRDEDEQDVSVKLGRQPTDASR